MWPILKAALRTGVVTRPLAELERPALGFRGRPALDAARCIGDGACARACPSGALVVEAGPGDETTFKLDYGACLFCGRCVDACGAGALAQSGDYALSVVRREDLVLSAVVRGSTETRP
jgi:formate hydrogenlyase subunit 6/NADH:ubiquinone oxidoreductase subunit I